ncbi:MAG TPA: PRC-barrel domain-containing protein [Syntrophorhabdaceae bacterium]|nr:PRC-barrel domain-containing protein [Syntrophorhabdaceae bacterium]
MKNYRKVLSCSTLTGDRVRNRSDEDLGKVEEIMIDLESGNIAYVVLSYGGVLGVGEKLFAVPWKAFEISEEEHEFILDASKDKLDRAPGFDKDNWPDASDPSWYGDSDSYWKMAV